MKLVSKSGQASEVSAVFAGTMKSLIAAFQFDTVAVAHSAAVGGQGCTKVSPRTCTPHEWKTISLRDSIITYLALSHDAILQSMLKASLLAVYPIQLIPVI